MWIYSIPMLVLIPEGDRRPAPFGFFLPQCPPPCIIKYHSDWNIYGKQ
ncbi:MAG: hypothetical protein L6461_20965 [Anaerolineae bacterium]|nr:hypothetical protein [Anaerolineae bacterium]